MAKQTKGSSIYAEDWLPIRNINAGVITNRRGELIAGVKIQPNNIFILDPIMQDNILIALNNFYNTLDYEFWLIVTDKPVDISVYTSNLQVLMNETQDQKVRKLIAQDMAKGKMFVDNDVVDTEYYLLFKEKKPDVMQKKIRELINGFASCNLIATQTTTQDMKAILDSFLNGGKSYEEGTVMP